MAFLIAAGEETAKKLATALSCWARDGQSMDSRIAYSRDCRAGSYNIGADVCTDYGPLPVTSMGQPIDCASAQSYLVTADDVQDLDPATCQSSGPQLAAPENLASPSQTDTSVDLSWNAVADATNYVVAWRTSPDGTWTELPPQAGTTVTVSGLDPDTAYDFRVKATADGFQDSPWSTVLTQSTQAPPQLATPQNAAAGTPTTTTIPFSWDAVTDAEQYVVRFKASTDTDWTERTAVTVTNDTITGLTADTQYDIQVKAQAAGFTDSEWSTTVQATTAA